MPLHSSSRSVVVWWSVVVVVGVAVLHPATAFNLLTEEPVALTPPDQRNIQFGFSLSHFYSSDGRQLLVGAPTTKNATNTTGGLYSCDIDATTPECRQVNIKQPEKYKPYIYQDLKDEERLGYSIASDGRTSIVVCAPRWHIFQDSKNRNEDFPYGICFYAEGLEGEFHPFSPPLFARESSRPSYMNSAACQFGMSVAYVEEHNTYAMGSPGCWTWQGDTWEVPLEATEDLSQQRRVRQLSLNDVGLTQQGGDGFTSVADLYLGYSVTSMVFGGSQAIVSSMPRTISTSDLRVGQNQENRTLGPFVYVFKHHPDDQELLQVLHRIQPPSNQHDPASSKDNKFTFFGYSVAALDFNGDGLQDLVVGAPFYHNSTRHDQGAIFVYSQQTFDTPGGPLGYEMKHQPGMQKTGRESFGRFGSCVAAIGDIDMDGYEDLAVGAPYQPGGGAVYIYSGSKTDIELTQVVQASALTLNLPGGLNSFGAAISTRLPAGSTQGFSVAVGAHEADAVMVFRTKEVVSLTWTMEFDGEMDLSTSECPSKLAATVYPCVRATVCLVYRTRNPYADTSAANLAFSITLKADTKQINKRLFFESSSSTTTANDTLPITKTLAKAGVLYCQRDIQINAKRDLKEVVKSFVFSGEGAFINTDNRVILDPHVSLAKYDIELAIKVECEGGVAGKCIADITLEYQILQQFTLGEEDPVNITFTVSNAGEPAYNTELQLNTMGYLKVEEAAGDVTCGEADKSGKITCDIDTIFATNAKTVFTLSLKPETKFYNDLKTHGDKFNIKASISTTSELANPDTAEALIQVPIKVEGTLDLTSKGSVPNKVNYNSSDYFRPPSSGISEEELGPHITHNYTIYNGNKFSIYSTTVTIQWPTKKKGHYLMYLLDDPTFTGVFATCSVEGPEVNPYTITSRFARQQVDAASADLPDLRAVRMQAKSASQELAEKGVEYTVFTCTFGELEKLQEASIVLHSRLVQTSITEIAQEIPKVSSSARLKIEQMPLQATPPSPSSLVVISTDIAYTQGSPEKVPVWIYIVSILGGLLVLAVIVLLLWKCGFFKRKAPETPEKGEESQPLEKADGGEGGVEEGGEDQATDTPHSPMMRETENANDEFRFSTQHGN